MNDGVGMDEPFPREGDTLPVPQWADERVGGLEVLDFRPDDSTHYRTYRYTISHEVDRDKSIASDTVMSLEQMR